MTTRGLTGGVGAGRGLVRGLVVVSLVVVVVGLVPAAQAQVPASGSAEAGVSDWRQVSAGTNHTCGIRTSGRLYCWGSDWAGQLGNGLPRSDRSRPVQAYGGLTNWASVSAGGDHTCAIKTSGRLYCWGANYNGQLGKGDRQHSPPVPGEVVLGAANWASVSAGDSHTCAVKANGRLFCWGSDDNGQLGNGGANTDRGRPNEVAGGAFNWASVSAGSSHTCAVKTTGRLFCWGDDHNGQLGDGGANTNRSTPAQVAGGATTWIAVSAGDSHTCAVKTTGRLFCWGYDGNGELGDGGANTDQPTPVQVAGAATNWASVSAGSFHTCAVKTTGRLYCWGFDGNGRLGDGGANTDRGRPNEVAGGFANWASVSAGSSHTCAVKTTGRLYCWGADHNGQLGNGSPDTSRFLPTQVFAP